MNQKSFANIILVIAIVILVGAVGYFVLVKKSEPQQFTPTSTQTKTPVSPMPTQKDKTTNWKTFSNGNYLYSIKYPDDWPTVSSIEAGQMSKPIGLHGPQLLGGTVYFSRNLPEVKPPHLQIESFSNQSRADFERYRQASCTEPVFTVTEITLDGIPAIVGHRISPDEPGQPYSTGYQYCALIYNRNILYVIDWGEGSFEDSGLFNQILSTLQFLE